MSLIICAEPCRHQRDGYCALDRVARLTSDAVNLCGYYEAAPEKQELTRPMEPISPESEL